MDGSFWVIEGIRNNRAIITTTIVAVALILIFLSNIGAPFEKLLLNGSVLFINYAR